MTKISDKDKGEATLRTTPVPKMVKLDKSAKSEKLLEEEEEPVSLVRKPEDLNITDSAKEEKKSTIDKEWGIQLKTEEEGFVKEVPVPVPVNTNRINEPGQQYISIELKYLGKLNNIEQLPQRNKERLECVEQPCVHEAAYICDDQLICQSHIIFK